MTAFMRSRLQPDPMNRVTTNHKTCHFKSDKAVAYFRGCVRYRALDTTGGSGAKAAPLLPAGSSEQLAPNGFRAELR